MATITEDYVSFETAKLLKEKGFKEECNSSYSLNGEFLSGYTKQEDFPIKAPTQQMAMKWLRNAYNFHIDICIGNDYSDDVNGNIVDSWSFWSFSIHGIPSGNVIYNNLEQINCIEYQSYEDACEAAIKYCLENLI